MRWKWGMVAMALLGGVEAGAQPLVSTRQVRRADSVRTNPALGSRVTITGRVILIERMRDSSRVSLYVQDSSGSVLVRGDAPVPFSPFVVGDSVVVTGDIARSEEQPLLGEARFQRVPGTRREPRPASVQALVPANIAAVSSRLVQLEGFIAATHLGRGEEMLTLADSSAEGNYITILDDATVDAPLLLDRFSIGDRVRVTGVLVRRTSRRTSITRFTVYPRSASDIEPMAMTARTRGTIIRRGLETFVLVAAILLFLRSRRRRKLRIRVADTARRENEARYRRLVEQAPIGIVVHREGRILFANTAFTRLVATENDGSLPETDLVRLIHPDDRALFTSGLFHTMEQTTLPQRTQMRLRRFDGVDVDVEVTDGPVEYAGQHCVQSVVYDVSERVRAEQALARSEAQLRQSHKLEAVGQLAGGIAHDFNNILTTIKGNTEFLLEGCAHCGAVPPEVREIDQAADRAAALTRQLLAFSRQQVVQPRVLPLDDLIRNLEPMLRRLVPENMQQYFLLDAADAHVNADPGQIEQVVMNLVVNARDAMARDGVICVETATADFVAPNNGADATLPAGRYVVLSVSDTGVGMDETTRLRAFEPFYTTKGQGKGTGLGLATVYGIISQANGAITIDSRRGEGTIVRVYLPMVQAAPDVAQDEAAVTPSCRGRETILLVEDEPEIRRVLARTLERKGYRVLVAEHGGAALVVARAHVGPIDLLITDVIMPEMCGPEVATHLTLMHPSIKVLFISGYTDDHLEEHGVLAPGIELLEKPFAPTQLLERARHILDGAVARSGA